MRDLLARLVRVRPLDLEDALEQEDVRRLDDPSVTQAFEARVEPIFPPWVEGEDGVWTRAESRRGWDWYAVPAALLAAFAALAIGAALAIWRAGQIGGQW